MRAPLPSLVLSGSLLLSSAAALAAGGPKPLRLTNEGRHIAAALAKQGIVVDGRRVNGRELHYAGDANRREMTGRWSTTERAGGAFHGTFTFTNERDGVRRLTALTVSPGRAPASPAQIAALKKAQTASAAIAAAKAEKKAEEARKAQAAAAVAALAAKAAAPVEHLNPGLTRGANGFTYGAGPQGHANMLAADPGGRRTGYVNPQAPVTRFNNMWVGHYR